MQTVNKNNNNLRVKIIIGDDLASEATASVLQLPLCAADIWTKTSSSVRQSESNLTFNEQLDILNRCLHMKEDIF